MYKIPFNIAFFILLLTSFSSFSQGINVDLATEIGFIPKNISNANIKALGSPYVEDNYQSVRIKNYETKIYSGRYNAYLSEMEILLSEGRDPIALDITNNDYEVIFINENKTYKSCTYTTARGVSKRGFLVIVSDENGNQLLKEENIQYYDKVPATSSYDKDKPAKFKREDDIYYVSIKNNTIIYLPSKMKDISKLFPNKSNEIESYVKKNKIKTKNEEDLIKLVNFIGTL